MCGIAGIVQLRGREVERPIIARMTDALRHRGPDAGGVHVEGNVALGSRRLSVIDTSEAANQPFANQSRTAIVAYNGEIYNFRLLRQELEAEGHSFRTRSDTEVLLRSWQAWGSGMLTRLRGMFAFAVFDARSGELFVARDRLGKKPLYFCASADRFLFASEIKALMEAPEVSREIEPLAVGDYAIYGNSMGDRTIFRHIRQLRPAHALRLDTRAASLVPRIERYWQASAEPDRTVAPEQWLELLDDAIAEAVELRMISDVPLGAFLSGGIDSSLIVAYMARKADRRVQTFSIGFEEAGFDESGVAAAVAEHLGTEHHTEIVTPDAIAILPDLVRTYDEPFADSSAIPTYYLSRLTRRRVTVALSGDGGDELFYGYHHYRQSLFLDRASRFLTPVGRRLVRRLALAAAPATYYGRGFGRLSKAGFDLYHDALGYREEFLGLLRPELRESLSGPTSSEAASAFHNGSHRTLLERYRATDLANYLPQDILVKVDRASMRHSLEVRCPLLDHKLVELAMRIPSELQMGVRRQKLLLRRLAWRYVPRNLLERPKMGFAVPLDRWFRHQLAPIFQEVLDHESSPMWEYFDLHAARRRYQTHLTGRSGSGESLWRLLFFHRWCETFLG